MKDFSSWKEYEGASEGSGRSEKIWLINSENNEIGLFKYKKDKTTTDHVSECIAYELAKLIQLPCAIFEVGVYMGREGSMSHSIINQEGMTLIEGIYFINAMYETYDAEKLIDIQTGEKYSLDMIKKSIEHLGVFNEFLYILIFDFLIGNTDRH